MEISRIGERARLASAVLAGASTEAKNACLARLAALLEENCADIVAVNAADAADGKLALTEAMVDRLTLNEDRIRSIAADVRAVVSLPDPVGEVFEKRVHPNGLRIEKRRVPIGVAAVLYESRPNVTVDAASLMIKAGNAVILRGGKETIRTNRILIELIHRALRETGLTEDSVQFIDSPDRALMLELLHQDAFVDIVIPRGGSGLHRFCRENSRIPVITGGIGVCHLFVDASADLPKAAAVVRNAKVQRPTVCNALETLLVHRAIAGEFLPEVCRDLAGRGVEFRVDNKTRQILLDAGINPARIQPAGPDDYDTEWLSLVLSVRVVDDLDSAISHIQGHSTGHSDGILTGELENARVFTNRVNSACVYVNASTRFTDGSQLGLGAEIAISTQPLHARGPMALRELTTYKWVIQGDYQVRL